MMATALHEAMAEIIRPSRRLDASEWAEQNRELKAGTTAQPGRWRNAYLPWLAPILDAFDADPTKEGWVWMKPTQVGGTEIAITLIGHLFTYQPGPTLFLCTTIQQARKFSIDRFEYMIDSTPILRRRFLRSKQDGETRLLKPAVGGSLILAGSGSPNSMLSNPCRYVFLDEEDRLPEFPGLGTGREIAEKRTAEYRTRTRTGIFSWAHPTTPERGVAYTYREQSDQREWHLVCPHCAELFVPRWEHVEIPDRDSARALYRCPNCGTPISDPQRWAASQRGRFQSLLDETAARRRRFAGFHVSRLCHPRIPLADIASEYVACHSESQLRVFWNMTLGEPYLEAAYVITAEQIRNKRDPRRVDRAAPSGTAFITAGVDVQKGTETRTLYYTVQAWTPDGNEHVLEYGRLNGWEALDALLRTFAAPVPTGDPLRIAAVGIDYGWRTREVYAFCRLDHAGVPCIPMKHTPGVAPDQPARQKRTVDPLHPEYGGLARLELCRDYWMDRALGRFGPEADPTIGGSTVLPANTSEEFVAHQKAARRVEIVDRHGHSRITWERPEGERDDWLQARVMGEVVAVGLGIDRLHEQAPRRPVDQDEAIRSGIVERGARFQRSGWVRGRRGRGGRYR